MRKYFWALRTEYLGRQNAIHLAGRSTTPKDTSPCRTSFFGGCLAVLSRFSNVVVSLFVQVASAAEDIIILEPKILKFRCYEPQF